MEEPHRQILRKNRTFMIENIANPLDVVENLFENGILTESMKQTIESKATSHDKVRELIDTLPKRGPEAFRRYCEALVETSNESVALGLDPSFEGVSHHHQAGQRGYAIPQAETKLPSNWPNEEAMRAPVSVNPCNVTGNVVRDYWLNENVYPMRKRKRGRCVVIGNKVFSGPLATDESGKLRVQLTNRFGTEQDEERLELLFTQLFFDVVMHKEKTAEEMLHIMQEEARHNDHDEADCFVCIVCSHGTERGIYGIDGHVLPLHQLTSCMDGEHCRALRGKPKVFFIQACQGEKADTAGDVVDGGQDLSLVFNHLRMKDDTDARKESTSVEIQGTLVPTKADMLVACATHPGYVSLRNTVYGSWFIQAVIYVFQSYAHKEDITQLLTLVNNLVSKGRTNENDRSGTNITQCCYYQSSLKSKLMFFPGIAADS